MKRAGILHHIEIYVSDLQRSMRFWRWFLKKLGYSFRSRWSRGEDWNLSDTYIVFVQAEKQHLRPRYHRCRVGLNHLAFHAASRRQVDETMRLLKRRKVRILYPDRHPYAGGPDYYALFFEDPDRIKVELVAPPPRAASRSAGRIRG